MGEAATYPGYTHFLVTSPFPYIIHVELNRPQKLNAFNDETFSELRDVFDRIHRDSEVRAVVLSGKGEKAFTSGLDLEEAKRMAGGEGSAGEDPYRKSRKIKDAMKRWQEACSAVEKCAKPVIAVLHGISYGLALDLVCCADIRICTTTTRFSLKEVDIGIAADLGTLTRLPKLISSMSFVKEIAYTARDFTAAEALQYGFVSKVVGGGRDEAVDKAMEVAKVIVEKSPVAVDSSKELLNYSVGRPVEDGLRYTQVWNSPAILAGDVKEAVVALLERRKPRFAKL